VLSGAAASQWIISGRRSASLLTQGTRRAVSDRLGAQAGSATRGGSQRDRILFVAGSVVAALAISIAMARYWTHCLPIAVGLLALPAAAGVGGVATDWRGAIRAGVSHGRTACGPPRL